MSGSSDASIWEKFQELSNEQQDILALDIFTLVLRNAGRNHAKSGTPDSSYQSGWDAIQALFPGDQWQGNISLTSREIKTQNGQPIKMPNGDVLFKGGAITLLAPGGQLTVGYDVGGAPPSDQGILTAHGGNISIVTNQNVIVGTSRIFTLRGGNEIIWSSHGDIAAGAASQTVQSAPPTRVQIDPQSGDVKVDLAGLATGGGIGVLAAVKDVPEGSVDLIAPNGTIDAGDAGIRATGNLYVAAVQVLNASNIQVSGASTGTPVAPAAPSIGLATAGNTSAASTNSADNAAKQTRSQTASQSAQDLPSLITVEVLGYGGGDGE